MQLYNTLSRKKEKFKPIKKGRVSLYACGPTVYDFAHIGNLRTFIFEDVLKRALIMNKFSVRHVMNITDIDNKTITGSLRQKEPLKKFTGRYAKFFKDDIKKLNILAPTKFAPATVYIKEMVSAVEKLLKKGVAYEKDGSIYFSLKKFPQYGRLSNLDKRELKLGATIDEEDYEKENSADFVLWKAWKEEDGPIFWETSLGKGRPGWHLECAIIANKELGASIDLHAGGVDLIFPHHENEIAEAESLTGKKFVRYWLHGEHLLVDDRKMSKSLKNFYTLRDLEEKGFNFLAYRYFVMQAHYRSKLNFTWEALSASQNALNKIYDMARGLPAQSGKCADLEKKFVAAIDNDLNIPECLAVLWELLKSNCPAPAKAASLLKFDEVLGLDIKKYLGKKIKIPKQILELAKKRDLARKEKDWKTADDLRVKIKEMGYEVEDTSEGTKIVSG